MALNTFGWTPAEVTQDSAGNAIAGVELTVWADLERTTPVQYLYARDGVTMLPTKTVYAKGAPSTALTGAVVTSESKGRFGFLADESYSLLYVWDGSSDDPWPVAAHEALDSGATTHAQAVADAQAAADSAAASAALVGAPADTAIAAAVNGAATQTRAALSSAYARKSWYDVKAYGAKGDGAANDAPAIQAAIDAAEAAGGTVYFPEGSYKVTAGLTVTANITILGAGLTKSKIIGSGLTTSTDLIYVNNGATAITGFTMSGMHLSYGGRHNLHIDNVRNAAMRDCVSQNAGTDGIYLATSWNIVLDNVQAYLNGRDGMGAASTAHAVTYNSCHVVSNVANGLNAASRSTILRPTSELNGNAGIAIINRDGVNLIGGYFEDDATAYSAADPEYHIFISGSQGVSIRDARCLQYVGGTAVHVENSRYVILDGLSTSHELIDTNSQDFGWATYDALGVYIKADCDNVRVGEIQPVPMFFGDLTKIRFSSRFDGVIRANLVGADGAFLVDSNADGLSDGWTLQGAPTPAREVVDGVQMQKLTSGATFQGMNHAVTLEANTTYTVIATVRNDGDAYFSTAGGGTRLGNYDFYSIDRPRTVAYQFTTGGTPPTTLGITIRQSGKNVWVGRMKVVKGAFTMNTAPLFGLYESAS